MNTGEDPFILSVAELVEAASRIKDTPPSTGSGSYYKKVCLPKLGNREILSKKKETSRGKSP